MRIGMGYDVHRLQEGCKLIMGGVEIPYEKGLLGHSDADVLVHAVMDALLGAAALGDIGKHFPDTDPAYKGISSILLLQKVGELLEEHCFLIEKSSSAMFRAMDSENITPSCITTPHCLRHHFRLKLFRLASPIFISPFITG